MGKFVIKESETGFHFNLVADTQQSILALAGRYTSLLLWPLGLGDWRISTALICGFLAKESVVSVLKVLFKGEGGVGAALSTLSAVSLLVFSLLYTPCVAAVASIRREMGRRWAWGVVIWQCVVAWIAAFVVTVIGRLFLG